MSSDKIDISLIRGLAEQADIGTSPRHFVRLLIWVNEQVQMACGIAAAHPGDGAEDQKPIAVKAPTPSDDTGEKGAPAVPEKPVATNKPAPRPQIRRGEVWSEEELATAVRLHGEGLTARKIAAQLGRPIDGTRQKLKSLIPARVGRFGEGRVAPGAAAVRKDAWTSDLDARLANLKCAGASIADIAKDLGRTPAAVEMRLRHLRQSPDGPALPPETWTAEEDRALIDGREAGRSYTDLAAEMRRSVRALQNRVSKLKRKAQSQPDADEPPASSPEPANAPSPAPAIPVPTRVEPAQTAPDAKADSAGPRVSDLVDLSGFTARQRRVIDRLNRMSDDFEPVDDLDVIVGLAKGQKPEAIADNMGCRPRDVTGRWRKMLFEDLVNIRNQITIEGQEDLLIAARHLAARAAADE